MENIWSKIIKVAAAIGGGISGLFGGWNMLLTVMAAMMCADYISGIVVALLGKSPKTEYGGLSSKAGAAGLARKGLMLLVVLVASLLDRVTGGGTTVLRDAVSWFYIANEGLSLLENLNLAGVPFPERMKELLGVRKDGADRTMGETAGKTE